MEDIFQKLGVDLLDDVIGVIQKVVKGILGTIGDLILLFADGLNTAINIPILTPLDKKMTDGADLAILDVLCLCLAIPPTLTYKLITGNRPKGIPYVGDLVKLNAMKPELDERMGRVKKEAPDATPGEKATKQISADTLANIKRTQDRFIANGITVSFLLKIGIPAGAQLWYTFSTWPKQMIPTTPYSFKAAILSTACGLIPWLLSAISLFKLTPDQLKDRKVDVAKQFDDLWFRHRFRIWVLGALAVGAEMAGREAGYCFLLTSSVGQVGLLLWMQIEAFTGRRGMMCI